MPTKGLPPYLMQSVRNKATSAMRRPYRARATRGAVGLITGWLHRPDAVLVASYCLGAGCGTKSVWEPPNPERCKGVENSMIPTLSQSGFLPPFLPNAGPTEPAAMAPYQADLVEVVQRFAWSPERAEIMRGLLNYRQQLRQAGIHDGFQWVDGSYMEDCEKHRSRPPSDIDLVTFAERPTAYQDAELWKDFVASNRTLFDPPTLKRTYRCDAYYEDLGLPSKVIVSRSRYWFGLFSHQRVTYLWKGLLMIPLQSDDSQALALLGGSNHAS